MPPSSRKRRRLLGQDTRVVRVPTFLCVPRAPTYSNSKRPGFRHRAAGQCERRGASAACLKMQVQSQETLNSHHARRQLHTEAPRFSVVASKASAQTMSCLPHPRRATEYSERSLMKLFRTPAPGLVFLLTAPACSSLGNCPQAQPDVSVAGDQAIVDAENFVFVSAPDSGPLDAFPAMTQLVFSHGLGVKPYDYHADLSFTKNGTNGVGSGSITTAAGNEAAFECVDSRVLVVKNDTCEGGFFVRVVAQGSPKGDADDTSCGK
jgi:hypothetical protein